MYPKFFVILAVIVAISSPSETKLISAIDIAEKFGYPTESHKILTEDGYILTAHRILQNATAASKNTSVVMMHGMASSSANWVDMGPNRGLGFILSDLGYDVWLCNARGNGFSNEHATLNATENPAEFYNFSYHEIGYFDLPATIDYVLNLTQQSALQYVGVSQGGGVYFVMASTRPEYNSKIRLATLMGPGGIMKNASPNLKFISQYVDLLEELADENQIYNTPGVELMRTLGSTLCAIPAFQETCRQVYFLMLGYPDNDQLELSTLPIIFQTIPADAAVKQYFHFAQGIKSGLYRQYDWGLEGNRIKYGSDTPPEYDITAITSPLAIYYGKNDAVISQLDVEEEIKLLPNVVRDYLIPYEKFNHADFVYAKDIRTILFNELISKMLEY